MAFHTCASEGAFDSIYKRSVIGLYLKHGNEPKKDRWVEYGKSKKRINCASNQSPGIYEIDQPGEDHPER